MNHKTAPFTIKEVPAIPASTRAGYNAQPKYRPLFDQLMAMDINSSAEVKVEGLTAKALYSALTNKCYRKRYPRIHLVTRQNTLYATRLA